MNTYLIDTNIIVYAYNEDYEDHSKAKEIVDIALNGLIDAWISDKNLLEFFAIITDSRRVEKPVTIEEAKEIIDFLINSAIKIIYSTPVTLHKTFELAKKYNISRQNIFDMILVALMIENKISTILTGNEKDFKSITEIKVVNPMKSNASLDFLSPNQNSEEKEKGKQ